MNVERVTVVDVIPEVVVTMAAEMLVVVEPVYIEVVVDELFCS